MDSSGGGCFHPEEVRQQDRLVTFRAQTAYAEGSAKKLTRWTPAFADEALIATGTFINRVRYEQPLALELLADERYIRVGSLLTTQSKSELLAGRRTVDCAAARERRVAQQAGACAVRRT